MISFNLPCLLRYVHHDSNEDIEDIDVKFKSRTAGYWNTINAAITQTFPPRFFEGSGTAVIRLPERVLKNFIPGGSAPRSNPLPFYIPIFVPSGS